MDIERTKQFYRELKQSDLCGCAYCRNYVKEAANFVIEIFPIFLPWTVEETKAKQ